MKRPPTLKSAMTPFPYSVERRAPVARARQLMAEHGVHHLPVTEGHLLTGVITDRDIIAQLDARGPDTAADLAVGDVCISDPYIVDLNEPLANVLLKMSRDHIGSTVVTRHGKLAGMFTPADACRCFGEYLEKNFSPNDDGGDAA